MTAEAGLRFRVGDATTEVCFLDVGVVDAIGRCRQDSTSHLCVIDEGVADLCRPLPAGALIVPSGERAKRWEQVATMLDAAMERRVERNGYLIAVGGGVICDMAAFAAAIYLRGIGVRFVPTTLLCMLDAALGGKSGINWRGYKNMVGAFHPADRIVIAPRLVATLADRDYRSGLAEAIKCALLGDVELFGLLRLRRGAVLEREPAMIEEIVRRSLAIKGEIVENDFREAGRRAHLNLGHTFAHALESVGAFGEWTHGEAVAWGIVQSLRLGVRLGLTDSAYAATVTATVESYNLPTTIPNLNSEALLAAMRRDKKVARGAVHFVLQRELGATFIQAVPLHEISRMLQSPESLPPL